MECQNAIIVRVENSVQPPVTRFAFSVLRVDTLVRMVPQFVFSVRLEVINQVRVVQVVCLAIPVHSLLRLVPPFALLAWLENFKILLNRLHVSVVLLPLTKVHLENHFAISACLVQRIRQAVRLFALPVFLPLFLQPTGRFPVLSVRLVNISPVKEKVSVSNVNREVIREVELQLARLVNLGLSIIKRILPVVRNVSLVNFLRFLVKLSVLIVPPVLSLTKLVSQFAQVARPELIYQPLELAKLPVSAARLDSISLQLEKIFVRNAIWVVISLQLVNLSVLIVSLVHFSVINP